MEKFGIIGTWAFSLDGITKAYKMLKQGATKEDALEVAVCEVEDSPLVRSVGVGGLPNEEGVVELDGAFMDGDTLSFGAVSGIRKHKNLIGITKRLSKNPLSCFLVGEGADKYAKEQGYPEVDLLTPFAEQMYKKRIEEDNKKEAGHDTVGMIALKSNSICCGVSTSGLFMKKVGRCGDSPIIGNGFYADSDYGAAAATGVGEDINKGSICIEIVRLLKSGLSVQDAASKVVFELNELLIRKRGKAEDISVVAMDKDGNWGAATNTDDFSFVVATSDQEPKVYRCINEVGQNNIFEASKEWVDEFFRKREINREIL